MRNFFSKLIRLPLLLIPKTAKLPILKGPLFGKKWIVGSGVHGYWLGTYEEEKVKAFSGTIKKGDTVLDVGAQAGFYSMLAAELLGDTGKVFAFEPLPKNVGFIKKHMKINNYHNVVVEQVAASNTNGRSKFLVSGSFMGSLSSASGDIMVETVTIDDYVKSKRLTPSVIKMDIEGGEYNALRGTKETLTKYHPIILLATHGDEQKTKCLDLLKNYGYHFENIAGKQDEFIAKI